MRHLLLLLFLFPLAAAAQNTIVLSTYTIADGAMILKRGDTLYITAKDECQYIYKGGTFTGALSGHQPGEGDYIIIKKLYKYMVNGQYKAVANAYNDYGKWICELDNAAFYGEIKLPEGNSFSKRNLSKWPYISGDTLWLSQTAYLREGDYLPIGKGMKPNGDYQFISVEYGKGEVLAGRRLRIIKFYESGLKTIGYKFIAKLAGESKLYKCDVENAALSGEIIVAGMAAKSAAKPEGSSVADELLKFKKLKDEGAITEEEYQEQKKKLLSK